ncbi:anhydro-N-acetylmuramic acid kinase [soil metagenome]
MTIIAGLMSGTSLDGVDGVLVQFDGNGTVESLLAHSFIAFDASLRDALARLQSPGDDELHRSALAANRLAEVYATLALALIDAAGLDAGAVACIAAHGQTVRHRPELGYTLQLNNPALLAEKCGVAVVADFRTRDVAAGGQGAPLVPAFHRSAFGRDGEVRLIVNLGGIANVTLLDGRDDSAGTIGYDIGPANVLMDGWVEHHLGEPFDRNGAWASIGEIDFALLEQMLADPFFALTGPRSTGRDHFNRDWLEEQLLIAPVAAPEDVQRTLLALTVELIAREVESRDRIDAVVLCGGGAYNHTLIEAFKERVALCEQPPAVLTSQSLGIAAEHVEAMAFAWLGWARLAAQAGNLPAVTGAAGPRVLGSLTPR